MEPHPRRTRAYPFHLRISMGFTSQNLTALVLGVLADWNTAVYFSIVTMTSVGYGDVILSGDWRLLAAFQAMNGMLLFGLTTAFLFTVLQQCWRSAYGKVPSGFASSHKEESVKA